MSKAFQYHPERPKQPQTTYFAYLADKRSTVTGSTTEIAKIVAEMWKIETEDVKKQYNETFRIQQTKFKKDLESFYAKYPEEKKREDEHKELQKLQKQEKQDEKQDKISQPKESKKPSAKAVKDYFFVAYLKKFRDKHKHDSTNKFIPCSTKTVKMINQQYDEQVLKADLEKEWQNKWMELAAEQRKEIVDFLAEWRLYCKM